MITPRRLALSFSLVLVFLLTARPASAQERLCDPSFENCYAGLIDLVRNETVGIDNRTARNLFPAPYDPAVHRYWRITHDPFTGNVVFATASANPSLSGSWVARYSERWDTASVPVGAVILEIKAGTWQPEAIAPGTVIFDNFRLARL